MLPLLMLAAGCRREDLYPDAPANGVTLTAAFDIPEAIQTRSTLAGETVNSLWLMVFDEYGTFRSRHQGIPADGDDYSRCTFSDVPLSGGRSRTLHFVANYDWSGFSDANRIGDLENALLRRMNVEGGTVAYWQRLVLPEGIHGPVGGSMVLNANGPIRLLRNVAMITVANLTTQAEKSMGLTGVEFAVGNAFDKGAVAPFNTTTASFGNGADSPDFVIEASDGNPSALTPAALEAAFRPAQNGAAGAASAEIQLYERKNSVADRQTYVIVKGYFHSGGTTATQPSYYKIDICENNASELLDIQRNYRYKIEIVSVLDRGYDNPEDAMANFASNNIVASVEVSEFPAISDGYSVLTVENTSFTYTEAGMPFSIGYSYLDGNSGALDNEGITVDVEQTPGRHVVLNGAVTATGGFIRGTTAAVLPASGVYEATITISKGNLRRVIRLQLRPVMTFLEVTTDPADGWVGNNDRNNPNIGSPAAIRFKFPGNVSPSLFPMPVYIYTKRFVPAPGSGLSIDFVDGDFRYVYYAEYLVDADGQPVAHTIPLLSNSRDTRESVGISAERFKDASVVFRNLSDIP